MQLQLCGGGGGGDGVLEAGGVLCLKRQISRSYIVVGGSRQAGRYVVRLQKVTGSQIEIFNFSRCWSEGCEIRSSPMWVGLVWIQVGGLGLAELSVQGSSKAPIICIEFTQKFTSSSVWSRIWISGCSSELRVCFFARNFPNRFCVSVCVRVHVNPKVFLRV